MMIHIAYALSDKHGTYSKFVGASISSILANTNENVTDIHGVFNAGVMLLNLRILRRRDSLLLEGLNFLKEHVGQWKFYDNDILIGLFAKRYIHLPWCFYLRLGWARAYGGDAIFAFPLRGRCPAGADEVGH